MFKTPQTTQEVHSLLQEGWRIKEASEENPYGDGQYFFDHETFDDFPIDNDLVEQYVEEFKKDLNLPQGPYGSITLKSEEERSVKRTFIISSESWYYDVIQCDDDITVMYEDSKTNCEFMVKIDNIGGEECLRLHIYDDTWKHLPRFSDLFEAAGDMDKVTKDLFIALLKRLGFEDITKRKK